MSPTGSRRPRPAGTPRTLKGTDTPGLRDEIMRSLKAPHRPCLVVLSGEETGKRVLLDRSIVMGRDPSCELPLTDARVSWHHARVEDRGDGWVLFDLGSTNGTRVNGELRDEYVLAPNDRIVLADSTALTFELQDALKEAYNTSVERLLNIDDLSGLFVRRKFDAELAILLERARVQEQPLSLLVMDLDGIKRINDTHGHLFGAYVIGEAGRRIATLLQGRGIGCRFGGDEYLAALPALALEPAEAVADEILADVNRGGFEREGIPLKPGISIGVAVFPSHAHTAERLFQCADEALYRAKQGGKNRRSR